MNKLRYLAFSIVVGFLVSCKDDPNNSSQNLNNLAPGASARDILSAENYSSLEVELTYPAGFAPPSSLDANIENFINEYCHKPQGVVVSRRQISEPSRTAYTLDQIKETEDAERSVYTEGNTLGIHIFFAGGDYVSNSDTVKTLGIAYRNTSAVIFQNTIKENSGGLGRPTEAQLTATVVKHELGHLMGLVNIGSNMQSPHEDSDHHSHCTNNNCLMYWAIATTFNLLGNHSPQLGSQCEADLVANGGK